MKQNHWGLKPLREDQCFWEHQKGDQSIARTTDTSSGPILLPPSLDGLDQPHLQLLGCHIQLYGEPQDLPAPSTGLKLHHDGALHSVTCAAEVPPVCSLPSVGMGGILGSF